MLSFMSIHLNLIFCRRKNLTNLYTSIFHLILMVSQNFTFSFHHLLHFPHIVQSNHSCLVLHNSLLTGNNMREPERSIFQCLLADLIQVSIVSKCRVVVLKHCITMYLLICHDFTSSHIFCCYFTMIFLCSYLSLYD